MRDTLQPGLKHSERFAVTAAHTVPELAVDAAEIKAMPAVLATPYMIAMMEVACTNLIKAHADPGEGSLGIAVNVTHLAATLPGQIVTVDVEVVEVAGRRVGCKVSAHDGLDKIGEGRHDRMVVPWDRVKPTLAAKAAKLSELPAAARY
jgi:fluoroacetyl-CoA thioesterase